MSSQPRVLVPVNLLDRAKGRLSTSFTPSERRDLAIVTLRTIVQAAQGAGCPVTILSADESLASLALDAAIDPEAPGIRGLTPQLEHWLAANSELEAVLILHADLPLATASSIRALIETSGAEKSATAVRSADGGTNAMLLRPAAGMALHYGPNSFALHQESALASGYEFIEHRSKALSLDLDTPDDVRLLLASVAGRSSAAGKYLAQIRDPGGSHQISPSPARK